jgi:hypothetical protein
MAQEAKQIDMLRSTTVPNQQILSGMWTPAASCAEVVGGIPTNTNQRLWDLYATTDEVPDIRHWPIFIAKLGLSDTLDPGEGVTLFKFLTRNGVSQDTAVDMLIERHGFEGFMARYLASLVKTGHVDRIWRWAHTYDS